MRRFAHLRPRVVLATLLIAVVAGCSKQPAGAPKSPTASATAVRATKWVTIEKHRIERVITVLGSLESRQEAVLSAKVPGRLKEIHVDIGSEVKTGAILARVEPRDYELKLLQSEAAFAQARARLGLTAEDIKDQVDAEKASIVREARAVYDEARANRDRARNLDKEKLVSKSDVESAEAAYTVAFNRYQASLDEARQRQAAIAERKAELESARQALTDTTLLAPFDGVVQGRLANQGQYLKEGDSVITLVQINPLRLHLEVPEHESVRVQVGQEIRFSATGETKARRGYVARVSPALDKKSRVLIVEADVPNDGSLHPGAFVRAEIVVDLQAQAFTVPPTAIRTFAGLHKVVVATNGTALEKSVTVGARSTEWVEIVAGLAAGEKVAEDPGALRNGDAVTPQPAK